MSSYHLPSLIELALYKRETFSPTSHEWSWNNKSCVFLNLYVNSSGNYPHLFKAHRAEKVTHWKSPKPKTTACGIAVSRKDSKISHNSSFIFAYQLLPDHSNQEKLLHSYQGIYNQYVKVFNSVLLYSNKKIFTSSQFYQKGCTLKVHHNCHRIPIKIKS